MSGSIYFTSSTFWGWGWRFPERVTLEVWLTLTTTWKQERINQGILAQQLCFLFFSPPSWAERLEHKLLSQRINNVIQTRIERPHICKCPLDLDLVLPLWVLLCSSGPEAEWHRRRCPLDGTCQFWRRAFAPFLSYSSPSPVFSSPSSAPAVSVDPVLHQLKEEPKRCRVELTEILQTALLDRTDETLQQRVQKCQWPIQT